MDICMVTDVQCCSMHRVFCGFGFSGLQIGECGFIPVFSPMVLKQLCSSHGCMAVVKNGVLHLQGI